MNIRHIITKMNARIKLLLGIFILLGIAFTVYFSIHSGNLTKLLSFAAVNKCTSAIKVICSKEFKTCDPATGLCVGASMSGSTTKTCTVAQRQACINANKIINLTTCNCLNTAIRNKCTSQRKQDCLAGNQNCDPVTGNCIGKSSTKCIGSGGKCVSGRVCCAGLVEVRGEGSCMCSPEGECINGTVKKGDVPSGFLICKNGKWVATSTLDTSSSTTIAPLQLPNLGNPPTDSGTQESDQTFDNQQISNTGQPSQPPCPAQQKEQQNDSGNQSDNQTCDDSNCANVRQGNLWGIINCETEDSDGDMQLCNAKGRLGTCQEKQFCCPASGQKWTQDMKACPITKANLSVTPTQLSAGQVLTATFSSIPAPSFKDWLGMYPKDKKDDRDPTDWNYVRSSGECTKTEGDAKDKGSCTFTIQTTVPAGTYELRLFSSDTFSKLATSNTFSITNAVTPTPTPGGLCCACPAPTPVYAQSSCNGSCMTSFNCPTGQVCLLAESYGWVCRNPACTDSPQCFCTSSIVTPTPTPVTTKSFCNESCLSTSECRSGYRCVYISSLDESVCRNPKCTSSQSCVCPRVTPTVITKGTEILSPTPTATVSGSPTPTGIRLNALPTPIPSPTPIPVNPSLTINPFTDKTGKASQKFTISGTSDPFAEIDIRFDPDSVGQITAADAKGSWRYILTKSLTTGKKELTVTARMQDGGETQVKQSFIVKSGSSFGSLFLGFLIIAIIGGIGFFIYQKQMNDQTSLFSQFPPFNPSSEEPAPPSSSEEKVSQTNTETEATPPEPFISPEGEKPEAEKPV